MLARICVNTRRNVHPVSAVIRCHVCIFQGSVKKMNVVLVQGKMIRYVHIPDEVDAIQNLQDHVSLPVADVCAWRIDNLLGFSVESSAHLLMLDMKDAARRRGEGCWHFPDCGGDGLWRIAFTRRNQSFAPILSNRCPICCTQMRTMDQQGYRRQMLKPKQQSEAPPR